MRWHEAIRQPDRDDSKRAAYENETMNRKRKSNRLNVSRKHNLQNTNQNHMIHNTKQTVHYTLVPEQCGSQTLIDKRKHAEIRKDRSIKKHELAHTEMSKIQEIKSDEQCMSIHTAKTRIMLMMTRDPIVAHKQLKPRMSFPDFSSKSYIIYTQGKKITHSAVSIVKSLYAP